MSFAPLVLVAAYVLNVLSIGMNVDDQQMHPAHLQVWSHRNPGPAEIELAEAGHTEAAAPVMGVTHPRFRPAPSSAATMHLLGRLPAAPARPLQAAMPLACSLPVSTGTHVVRWESMPASLARPHEPRCHPRPRPHGPGDLAERA